MRKEICINNLVVAHSYFGEKKIHCHLIIERESCNTEISLRLYGPRPEITMIADKLVRSEDPDLIISNEETLFDNKDIFKVLLPSDKFYHLSENAEYIDSVGPYTLLKTTEAQIFYKSHQTGKSLSSFYHLSKQAISIISENYRYYSSNIGKWEGINRECTFKKFLGLKFRFILTFEKTKSFAHGDSQLILEKNPILELEYEATKFDPIEAESLIKLLSFYTKENIEFHFSFYNTPKYKVETHKTLISTQYRVKPERCKHSSFDSLYSFIDSVSDPQYFINNYHEFENLVDRFVLTSGLKNELKFMVYFSIIESVRKLLVKSKSIDIEENFSFKEKPDSFLNHMLIDNIKRVSQSDVDIYRKSLQGKITNIKRYPMKEQFLKVFGSDQIKVDFKEYNLDFNEVLKLRNKIFHGSILKDYKRVNSINQDLEKIASKMIRLILGSEDNFDLKK